MARYAPLDFLNPNDLDLLPHHANSASVFRILKLKLHQQFQELGRLAQKLDSYSESRNMVMIGQLIQPITVPRCIRYDCVCSNAFTVSIISFSHFSLTRFLGRLAVSLWFCWYDRGIEMLKLILPLYWYDHYRMKISTTDFQFAKYSISLRYATASDFVDLKDFSFRIRLLLYITRTNFDTNSKWLYKYIIN